MENRQTIDAKILSRMFLAGAKNLEAKKEWINELNVFPVPDGDTGTNMTLTILSAVAEVRALEDPDMEKLAKAISSGSLKGARGNSGSFFHSCCAALPAEWQSIIPLIPLPSPQRWKRRWRPLTRQS